VFFYALDVEVKPSLPEISPLKIFHIFFHKRVSGDSKYFPKSLSRKELRKLTEKATERAGFNLSSFCKLIKNLYLALNCDKNKDLDSLVSLRSQHDFLLS